MKKNTIKTILVFLITLISYNTYAQNLEDRIKNEIKKSSNEFYKKKILEDLEKKDYYNISAALAKIKADSTLVYESLRISLSEEYIKTCKTLLQIEHIEQTQNWNTPIYSLDKEKYLLFCNSCRANMNEPFDPSFGESKKRPFEIDPNNRSLYELSIIIKERDQLIRKVGTKTQKQEIDQENFLLIEYILKNMEKLSKEQKKEVILNMQIAMHHQPNVSKRNEYKEFIIKCNCVDLGFMNGPYQYRTDRIEYLKKEKE